MNAFASKLEPSDNSGLQPIQPADDSAVSLSVSYVCGQLSAADAKRFEDRLADDIELAAQVAMMCGLSGNSFPGLARTQSNAPLSTTAVVDSVSLVLASLIGERQFNHWFREKTRFEIVDKTLVVNSANVYLQKWLQKQHRPALVESVRTVLGPSASVRFEVDSALTPAAARHGTDVAVLAEASPLPVVAAKFGGDSATTDACSAVPRHPLGRRFADLSDFVAGACNELALAAVRQVCEHAHGATGPLFIYGTQGTGKTHLLEGLYRELRRRQPSLLISFLTSEQFNNHFTSALRDHTMFDFRQRFRTLDVLLVDDIDYLDAKRVVQDEFLHALRQLECQNRLVVACGDRHPMLLSKISDELKTRFLSGMVCQLEAPDLDTRERIAASKARRLDADFSPEVLKYVAKRFSKSVRELEGALHCLQVYHRMTGKRVGLTAAREVLADLERDCLKVVRMADIERAVCELFGLDAADLKSSRRSRSFSEPRLLAMYLARRHTRAAYSEIGKYFGGRNGATVISADHKVACWIAQDAKLTVVSQTWRLADVLDALEQQLLCG